MENISITSWTSLTLGEDSISLLKQYYKAAQAIGVDTASYIRLVMEKGRMETTMVNGSQAIIRLLRIFGIDRLEAACTRALQGNKYNYKTIKNILINHLDEQAPVEPAENSGGASADHENLRGWLFFDKTQSTQS